MEVFWWFHVPVQLFYPCERAGLRVVDGLRAPSHLFYPCERAGWRFSGALRPLSSYYVLVGMPVRGPGLGSGPWVPVISPSETRMEVLG